MIFGNCLLRMGSTPSQADQDTWWRKSDNCNGYDYIATHVDDIICVARDPSKYMAEIKKEFVNGRYEFESNPNLGC